MLDVLECTVFFFEDASASVKWTIKTSFNKKLFILSFRIVLLFLYQASNMGQVWGKNGKTFL